MEVTGNLLYRVTGLFSRKRGGWRQSFIPKKIIIYISVTGIFSKTCRLETHFYTEENKLFLYPVTDVFLQEMELLVSFSKTWRLEALFCNEENNLFLYPVTGNLFEDVELLVSFSKTWRLEALFYNEENNHFYTQLLASSSKTWRLETFIYTEENNLYLYPVTGVLFEDVEVGGLFYTEENNLFYIQLLVFFSKTRSYWFLFENVEIEAVFYTEENNLFLYPVTGDLFDDMELLVSFSKMWRLEADIFIPKKIIFLYPVTGDLFEDMEFWCLFEDVEVGDPFYTEENNLFYIQLLVSFSKTWRLEAFFIPKKIIFLYPVTGNLFEDVWSYWCPFRRRWMLEALFYTEENNLFYIQLLVSFRKSGVTGILFEDVEVGGPFYTEENNLFLYPVTGIFSKTWSYWCLFRRRGGWRPIFIPKKIIFFISSYWCPLEDVEVGGQFLYRRK
ncbi:hypothetical protein CEXT_354851 [Caerostris extrusa]|uniref:Uncharacterized protein n=1 Tax=Caerostris extrusa TaxID=172846 RepID=A0AAV4VMA4_CAEEX|nr:hypothetical protein CEXT_354851 [Caerostris extrusa]